MEQANNLQGLKNSTFTSILTLKDFSPSSGNKKGLKCRNSMRPFWDFRSNKTTQNHLIWSIKKVEVNLRMIFRWPFRAPNFSSKMREKINKTCLYVNRSSRNWNRVISKCTLSAKMTSYICWGIANINLRSIWRPNNPPHPSSLLKMNREF